MELPSTISIASSLFLPIVSFFLGIIYGYEIRKVSARLQSRRGPWLLVPKSLRGTLGVTRLFQPLYDIIKLLCKESLLPSTSTKGLFRSSPYIALICVIVAAAFTPVATYSHFASFELSLVVILYLLLGVPFAFILGGAASASPWGVIGSQREAELMLGYETPLVIAAFSIATMADSLSVQKIIDVQATRLPFLLLNPLAAVAFLVAIIGKLHLKPFDVPEAEVEIVAGPVTEYGGRLLAIIEIVKTFLIAICVGLFIALFLAGGLVPGYEKLFSIPTFLLEGLLIVLVMTMIHTLNPRFRIDQALIWYVRVPTILAISGLVWAYAFRHFFPAFI